jgi:hypothetical protein
MDSGPGTAQLAAYGSVAAGISNCDPGISGFGNRANHRCGQGKGTRVRNRLSRHGDLTAVALGRRPKQAAELGSYSRVTKDSTVRPD